LSLAARHREPAFASLTGIKCEVMMKRLVIAALLLFPSIAHAEYFDTGNDLWGLCTDNVSGHNYLCIGMSTAYFDMMHERYLARFPFLSLACYPGGHGLVLWRSTLFTLAPR
jgi:hypothetical protein